MEEKKLKKSQFEREDDFNPTKDFSNSIQETWIHKQVVKKTGDGEDDFIIEEKPFLTDKKDLHKSINEEAKTTDLKYLLAQLLQQGITNPTGKEPELNKRPGFYGDMTQIQESVETGKSIITPSQIKDSLPQELKSLTIEQLATMSDEDIVGYFRKVKAENESKNVVDSVKTEENTGKE